MFGCMALFWELPALLCAYMKRLSQVAKQPVPEPTQICLIYVALKSGLTMYDSICFCLRNFNYKFSFCAERMKTIFGRTVFVKTTSKVRTPGFAFPM